MKTLTLISKCDIAVSLAMLGAIYFQGEYMKGVKGLTGKPRWNNWNGLSFDELKIDVTDKGEKLILDNQDALDYQVI